MYLNFTIAYADLQLGFLHNRVKQLFLMPGIICLNLLNFSSFIKEKYVGVHYPFFPPIHQHARQSNTEILHYINGGKLT